MQVTQLAIAPLGRRRVTGIVGVVVTPFLIVFLKTAFVFSSRTYILCWANAKNLHKRVFRIDCLYADSALSLFSDVIEAVGEIVITNIADWGGLHEVAV